MNLEGYTLLVDKPYQWTSFDVVNKIRSIFKYRYSIPKIKVGHAGTLDPLATGLLIVCIGKHTKQIEQYQALFKTYSGVFYLGATTPSFDMETEVDRTFPVDHITEELIEDKRKEFLGIIEQIPPLFSAIKIKGKRAFKHARKGEKVELKARKVNIQEFEIERIEAQKLSFVIRCSKGTYIRSMANDFGLALNSGAYLESLRRTAIGSYKVEDAVTMEQIEAYLGQKLFS